MGNTILKMQLERESTRAYQSLALNTKVLRWMEANSVFPLFPLEEIAKKNSMPVDAACNMLSLTKNLRIVWMSCKVTPGHTG